MSTVNRQITLGQDQKMIAGIQKNLANKSFTVSDKSYTTPEVVAVYQGRINTGQAVAAARAAWQAAVKANRAQSSQTASFSTPFQAIVKTMFQDPATLADFGLSPRKANGKTVQTKATAVAKNLATRKARGTMGKKQKASIKGNVTGIIVTPVTTPKGSDAPATPPTTQAGSE
jgi:hypothetical protein